MNKLVGISFWSQSLIGKRKNTRRKLLADAVIPSGTTRIQFNLQKI